MEDIKQQIINMIENCEDIDKLNYLRSLIDEYMKYYS